MSDTVISLSSSIDSIKDINSVSLINTSHPNKSNSQELQTSIIMHKLTDKWDMYYHLPHNKNWELSSYKKLFSSLNYAEEAISLCEIIPDMIIKSCMLFVMKEGITPLWEDPRNRNGGCFSFKISNNNVCNVWKHVLYSMVGYTLFKDNDMNKQINGITISPKNNFCILKVWMSGMEIQNPDLFNNIQGLTKNGCIFRAHKLEY